MARIGQQVEPFPVDALQINISSDILRSGKR
jgi:hypothetical protein